MKKSISHKQIEQINRLYLHFLALYPDCDEGIYLSGSTNQVLAFAAFAVETNYQMVREIIPQITAPEWKCLQQHIEDVVDNYLLRHAKVLALA